MKIKNQCGKQSHKLDEIGMGIRMGPFFCFTYNLGCYDQVKTALSESQAEAQEPTNHNASSQTKTN